MNILMNTSPFHATISNDPSINSTVIELSYNDQSHPERSISVSIAPELGSNMFRYRVGDYELIYCNRDALKQRLFTGNFVLWPLPNRIRDRRYSYQGQHYSLADVPRKEGNASLVHGLVFDQVWQYNQPETTGDAISVKTFIDITPESPHYDAYPFDSRLTLTYTLTSNGVSVSYLVENKGAKTLPFGFGLHPYFNLLSGKAQTIVSIPASQVMEADDELLPTGRVFDVNNIMYAMYDLRTPKPIGSLALDHVYTALQPDAPAIIDYSQQKLQLHLTATHDFTHMVIYTGTPESPFFCLENQTCSTDAVNLAAQDRQDIAHLLEVPAGDSAEGSIHFLLYFA